MRQPPGAFNPTLRQPPDTALDMQQKTEAAKDLKLLANVDSLAPARSALAGLHLRSNGAPALADGFPRITTCRSRDMQTFRQWASSLPLSRPHGLCRWQILFAISQMAQIPNGSSVPDVAACPVLFTGLSLTERPAPMPFIGGEDVNIFVSKRLGRRRREESHVFPGFQFETRYLVSYFPPAAARC